jgi:hypothetical protein
MHIVPTWWDSTSALDRINTWTQVAAVVFAVLAASATTLKIIAANRLSTLQAAGSVELASRLANAESNTRQLELSLKAAQEAQTQDVSRLQAELEKARQVAAAAEKAAAVASSRIAPRTLTAQQLSALSTALFGPPHTKVDIVAVLGDAESFSFARQLDTVLTTAGWSTSGVSQAVFTGTPQGVIIVVQSAQNPEPAAARLQQALKSIGIEAPAEVQANLPEHSIKLIVGHKP